MYLAMNSVHSAYVACRFYCTSVLCARPLINLKYEEKTCGEGPNLALMLDDDHYLASLGQESLVSTYLHTYICMSVCMCVCT